jgi:type IV pilus assembly protein PilN
MIRINLLAVERERARTRILIPAAHRVTIGATIILLGTAVLIGWWFWSLRQESARIDEELARAEVETRQIRSVLEQVRKFESQKAVLQQRVTLIEQLRKGQSGPVHILDEVSKALPDRLWLVSMAQRDKDFTFDCRATSLTVASDFVANLEASPWFKKPVELLDSQVDSTPQGPLVRFTIRATTDNPDAAPPAPTAGRGAPPAR